MGIFIAPKNTTAVQGIPIGRLNNIDNRVSVLEKSGGGAFPQMTTAQRLALSPINGQTAYDTTLDSPMIYIAGAWYSLSAA
jgi:hypothetical protein